MKDPKIYDTQIIFREISAGFGLVCRAGQAGNAVVLMDITVYPKEEKLC